MLSTFIPGQGIVIPDEELDEESIKKKAIEIFEQFERERVAPKFQEWREHFTYKIAEGGRGAGAKTWSVASLLVQKYHYSRTPLQCICVREFMNSLAESSYNILEKTIIRLGYAKDWMFTDRYIRNIRNGSYFIFRGLRDLRAAESLKSYEGYDDLFADEAADILLESWATIVPTLRKPTKEIWAIYNRKLEADPVHIYFVVNRRPNTSYLHLEPGNVDNPWWDQTTLQQDMEADYARDPDEAEHIWKGLPRSQQPKSIMNRLKIRAAMDRIIEKPDGGESIGVDIARFGDDTTQMYRRKGMKTIDHDQVRRHDIITEKNPSKAIALRIWKFAKENPEIPIRIDIGYDPGVADELTDLGANVFPINFGGEAMDKDRYPNAITEMWFEFPIEDADIPNDNDLMIELSGRLYDYDSKNRKRVEPKDDYKKRNGGKSPDHADALLLTYYKGGENRVYMETDYGISDLGL
jgi:phage terminase large subunit